MIKIFFAVLFGQQLFHAASILAPRQPGVHQLSIQSTSAATQVTFSRNGPNHLLARTPSLHELLETNTRDVYVTVTTFPTSGTSTPDQTTGEIATRPPPTSYGWNAEGLSTTREPESTAVQHETSETPKTSSEADSSAQSTSLGTPKRTRIARRKIQKNPLDVVVTEPDLKKLSRALAETGLSNDKTLTRVAMTVFAPVDSAFANVPFDITADDIGSIKLPNKTQYAESLFNYHVIAPKVIAPPMIKFGSGLNTPTRMPRTNLTLSRSLSNSSDSESDDMSIRVNGHIKVVEVIECVRGIIYKVDQIVFPPWRPVRMNLLQFIKTTPWLSKTRFLVEKTGLLDRFAWAGPITVLLIPDWGWTLNGFEIPDCVFESLIRPENSHVLDRFLKWTAIPGIWTRWDIERTSWLPNAASPLLSVTTVRLPLKHSVPSVMPAKRYPNTSWPYTVQADKSNEFVSNVFIEGREVTQWDIPLYNGIAHVISAMPERRDMEPAFAFWDCVHEICFSCPGLAGWVLNFLDDGGLVPDPQSAAYLVPPGVRPDWVCKGSRNWFPPGWKSLAWDSYLKLARKNLPGAQKKAHQGYAEAAKRLANLEDTLEESRIKLQRIKAYETRETDGSLKPKDDPSHLGAFMKWHRDVGGLPDCPGEDSPIDVSMNDMHHLARWL